MATYLDIVKMALGEIRVLKPGETPASEDTQDIIMHLNAMLASWAAEGLMIPVKTQENLTLTGANPITIGQSGSPTHNTVRPIRVMADSYITDTNGNDLPIDLLTRAEYNAIVDKSTSADIPTGMFYDDTSPNGTIYFDVPPTAGLILHLVSDKPFTSVANENTTYSLPDEYKECIAYNLAVRIAGPYNKALAQSTVMLAASTKRTLEEKNAAKDPIKGVVAISSSGRNARGGNIIDGWE